MITVDGSIERAVLERYVIQEILYSVVISVIGGIANFGNYGVFRVFSEYNAR